MKPSKDLFDLFRERQQLLEERPSVQTWRRLERRLDLHNRRHLTVHRRALAMAAAVLVLAVFLGVMGLQLGQKQWLSLKPQAENRFYVEHLNSQDADPDAIQMLEYNRQYQTTPILVEEGQASQKLVVKNDTGR